MCGVISLSWFTIGVEVNMTCVTCSPWNGTYDGTQFISIVACIVPTCCWSINNA